MFFFVGDYSYALILAAVLYPGIFVAKRYVRAVLVVVQLFGVSSEWSSSGYLVALTATNRVKNVKAYQEQARHTQSIELTAEVCHTT